MKKAMTLVELVFVVIIIGILSAVMAPNFQRSSTQEAANQIMSHIRYTQHLAMMDDKFSNTDRNWFKKRWQISFSRVDSKWRYVIYHDDANLTGNPNSKREVAKNPSNPNQYLIGWAIAAIPLRQITKKLNLATSFGITNVSFRGGCANAQRVSFDHLGRPFRGNPSTQNSAYQNNRYMTIQCQIQLAGNDGKTITIALEPETGYVHQL